MKEIDLATILAVFREMLGAWLWIGLAAAAVATVAFLGVLVRDRGVVASRLAWSELAGVAGGVAAVLVMQAVTHSGFSDIGGPIDWVLVALIFLAGAIGTVVAVYAMIGLVSARSARSAERDPGIQQDRIRHAPVAR